MMVNGRRSSQGEVRKGMHAQMVSFEDSIRDAVVPERSDKKEINNEQAGEHCAWVGLDWADEGHQKGQLGIFKHNRKIDILRLRLTSIQRCVTTSHHRACRLARR